MKTSIALFVVVISCATWCWAEPPFSLGPSELPAAKPSASTQPVNVASGLVEYMATRFEAHEPMYFLYFPDSPDVKFQLSLKYKLLGDTTPVFNKVTPTGSSFYLAYTQTTLWDISGNSAPIYDTAYKPELMYQFEDDDGGWIPGLTHFTFQFGYQHESNGKTGDDSRSMNILYVRPIYTFGDPGNHTQQKSPGGFFVTIAPRFWVYLNETEPEDLQDHRGYADLRITLGERGGVQFSVLGRSGEKWEHKSIECDVSCPLSRLGIRNPDFYIYAQYFLGYGESLLEYNRAGSSIRVGLALVR